MRNLIIEEVDSIADFMIVLKGYGRGVEYR